MKRIRYIVVACFTCLWCSCYQGMLLEDTFLDEENVMDVNPTPFLFSSLFPQTNGEQVTGRLGIYFLNKNQHGMLCFAGGSLMEKSDILSRMAEKLCRKGVRVQCAIDPKMLGGKYADKDAIYDSINHIIYFKNEGGIVTPWIILHELLHAFQTHLAGVEYTVENESQSEFEVLLMQDVFEFKLWGTIPSSEGRNSKEYKKFVSQIANFELSGNEGIAEERLIEMFKKYYKEWARGAATIYYRPSFLIYFLRYQWNF